MDQKGKTQEIGGEEGKDRENTELLSLKAFLESLLSTKANATRKAKKDETQQMLNKPLLTELSGTSGLQNDQLLLGFLQQLPSYGRRHRIYLRALKQIHG